MSLSNYVAAVDLLETLQVCDIIEFNRKAYKHFAFYIGDGFCVHVTFPDNTIGFGSIPTSSTRELSSAVKCVDYLLEIAKDSPCRVNNLELSAKQLKVSRRPNAEAITLATEGLPKDSEGKFIVKEGIPIHYDLFSAGNCEGYATYWRYGHRTGWSLQAMNGLVTSTIGNVQLVSDFLYCHCKQLLLDYSIPLPRAAVVGVKIAMGLLITVSCTANVVKMSTDYLTTCLTTFYDKLHLWK